MQKETITTEKLSTQAIKMSTRLREFKDMKNYAPVMEAAELLDKLADIVWRYEELCK